MKKLLILSMVISAITFAESEGNKMEIEVKVIRPLTIEVIQHIDLGEMVAGTNGSGKGVFTVKGEPEETYYTYIKELGKEKEEGIIKLLDEENSLDVALEIDIDENEINENGKNEHVVKADIKIPKDQLSGKYEGEITLALRYE